MSHISIRNSEEEDSTIIYFPVPDEKLTLDDLRSAFPCVTSIRYKDADNDIHHHILCRDNLFVEPDGGWHTEGRVYLAVNNVQTHDMNRFGVFESYRRQVSTRNRQRLNNPPKKESEKIEKDTSTMVRIGHGHFKNGIFSKISSTSLSGCGGIVVVGPFSKMGNTATDIKQAAFEKFCQMNRLFKQKFKRCDQFLLVYPDGSPVRTLPGSSEDFSLLGYRNSLDPNKRFDRLRLYICFKDNFESNDMDILTDSSSSSDELPRISLRNRQSTTSDTSSQNDTLPLTIDVIFHYKDETFTESFPNNVKGLAIISYLTGRLENTNFRLKITDTDKVILSDDRVTSDDSVVQIDVEPQISSSKPDIPTTAIHAGHAQGNSQTAEDIVIAALALMDGVSEPTAVLRRFQKCFLQGRQLDVEEESQLMEGETSQIFLSRAGIFTEACEELDYVTNIRFPLEINFHGEAAADYGGPRKEFYDIMLRETRERLMETGSSVLKKDDESLARQHYYKAGLIIGLSALQGGPCAEFLHETLTQPGPAGEEQAQFRKGLARTGILQLYEKKTTIKFLFMPSASNTLNVSKYLHLLRVVFSEEGTSRRVREENAYRQFVRYVREVYGGRRPNITLEMMLKFVTGMSALPLLGFAIQPRVDFSSDNIFPTARTCTNHMTLPLEPVSENLDMGFLNDYFGLE